MARAHVQVKLLFMVHLAATVTRSLNNGMGATPAMGYSTWNDCSTFRDNGVNGWCWNGEEHVRNVTNYLVSSGLAKLGYTFVNIDAGWLKGRSPNGTIYDDRAIFPTGMAALGAWIKSQPTYPQSPYLMQYGLYSCRGTCQCSTGTYSGPGSHGYEKEDTDWMVAAGADFIKIDSCCGDQDHAVAFSDYGKFRDALNATGKPVYFSVCGWAEWYSPPDTSIGYGGGVTLGNSWRIAGDGATYAAITNCLNTQAAAAPYAGPGGWPDPDLLIGPEVYVGGQSDAQARAQFTMWSIFPANLIISQNVLAWSSYALETYSNEELIAVNQDPLGSPARRLVGSDLAFPCEGGISGVVAVPCDEGDITQLWLPDAVTATIASVAYATQEGVLQNADCSSANGALVNVGRFGEGPCQGDNQQWLHSNSGELINGASINCLDVRNFTGPSVELWTCNGGVNQNYSMTASRLIRTADGGPGKPPLCIAARPDTTTCTNVWGRELMGGDIVVGFLNNGADPTNVTCDTACFADILPVAPAAMRVRDLWLHADIGTVRPPFSFTAAVAGGGAAAAFRFSPVSAT